MTQQDYIFDKIHILLTREGYEYIDLDIDGSRIYRKNKHDIYINDDTHNDQL